MLDVGEIEIAGVREEDGITSAMVDGDEVGVNDTDAVGV